MQRLGSLQEGGSGRRSVPVRKAGCIKFPSRVCSSLFYFCFTRRNEIRERERAECFASGGESPILRPVYRGESDERGGGHSRFDLRHIGQEAIAAASHEDIENFARGDDLRSRRAGKR